MPQIAGNQHNPNRSPFDDYPTHPDWTHALLDTVPIEGPLWEPACGDGYMSGVLRERGYDVRATDIRKTGDDFLQQAEPWPGSIVTNPPFKLLNEFLAHALSLAGKQVAMLMNISALAGKHRSLTLWYPTPPAHLVIVPKNTRLPVLNITSQFAHVWAVWDTQAPAEPGDTRFHWASVPGWPPHA